MNGLEIVFWHWWALAIVMLCVEILAPSFLFFWLSISAAIVGLILFLAPSTGLEMQLLIFSILSVASVLIWRYYGIRSPDKTDHPLLNQRGAQYIGRTFSLIEPIKNGRGKVKVDDSIWTVHGEDCVIDMKVEVIAVNGTLFEVKLIK